MSDLAPNTALSKTQHKRLVWRQTSEAVIELLAEEFPAAFFMLARRRRPLKSDIHADILARTPALPPQELSRALSWYTQALDYQRALMLRAPRIDLDGQPAGQVTEAEAESARCIVLAANLRRQQQTKRGES